MKHIIAILLTFSIAAAQAADYTLQSPDGQIRIRIETTDRTYYAVDFQGKEIMWYSPISMTLADGTVLGEHPKVLRTETNTVNATIEPVWGIRSEIPEYYNELILEMEGDFALIFRAYDDGVAYRFRTELPGEITVRNEEVAYRFLEDHRLFAHVVGDFQTSYEKYYTKYNISEVVEEAFSSLPLVVDQGDVKLGITESDLYDYPGMYIKRQGNNNRYFLTGLFPQYPTKWAPGGWSQFNLRVSEREDFIARTDGTRLFPWRVMIIAGNDLELADNDLVYKLARPAAIETDWIQPGKVAWDWWNDWNLTGVDFETGVNNQTYEYYIDFAAENGLEYIILDEGWSDQFDLLLQKPGVDVPALVKYGQSKGVKIILWSVWYPLQRQLTEALDLFEEWGIAGLKVDFFDRDDQLVINFYEELAREAAKRKLLVDYHGCSKPTGLHRTYPNLINYEAVLGNEYNKFSAGTPPSHNVDIVYTRMLAGPIDYTPGAMENTTQGNFDTNNSNPMSHGTRCHQLGMYVIYYSPLQMLCDAPTEYEKYPDILQFLSEVPVTWDETVALAGEMGKYVAIARQKDDDWYIGALNDWDERDIELDLSFLGRGKYEATLFLDGVNANRQAEDYQVVRMEVDADTKLPITLKKGGGAALQLRKK